MTTEVMTLGSIQAAPAGYYPGYGNPPVTVAAGQSTPAYLNRNSMPPTSPMVPQNLLRPTSSGCTNCATASSGAPITPSMAGLSGLAGRGTGVLGDMGVGSVQTPGGGICLSPQETQSLSMYVSGVSIGYRLLGTTVGAVLMHKRGSMGYAFLGGVVGFMAPLLGNAVLYLVKK